MTSLSPVSLLRARRLLAKAIVAGLSIHLAVLHAAAAGAMGHHIEARSQPVGVNVEVSTTKSIDSFGARVFEVTAVTNASKKVSYLSSIVEDPTSLIILAEHRGILYGHISGVLDGFTIFDPLDGTVLLQVPCIRISTSPDGKKIAFVRFFPPHFAPLGASSFVYAVLDATAEIGKPSAAMRDDAGQRVYPASDPGLHVASEDDVHRLLGTINWNSATRFTFQDKYHGVVSTVVASCSEKHWTASVVSTRPELPADRN